MSAWIWALIIVLILVVGFMAWFFLSSNVIPDGSSIPQPPALPSG